jgi:ligand-binding sensor domain-containing protein/signal transduction histidine kinase
MLTHNIKIEPVIIGLLLLCGSVIYAQNHNTHFNRITINDGLSLSSVYCIFQDSKGFMWFGTEDGLNKYDGTHFSIYNNQPGETNSLSHKWIEQIAEDRDGMIWLGSKNGLTRLDPKTDDMNQITTGSDDRIALSNDTIITLLASGKYIWVGTHNGINRVHSQSLMNTRYFPGGNNINCRIHALHKDNRGRIWIGASNGLFVNLPGYDNLIPIKSTENSVNVHSIETRGDTLWVGCADGILKYIMEDKLEVSFQYPEIRTQTHQAVTNLYKDKKSRLWVQTQEGLFLLNNNKQLSQIIDAPVPSPSLSVKPIKPLLEDTEGNLWYGTFGNGIYEIQSENSEIHHYTHSPANPSSLSDNTVNSLFQDRSGAIWVGTFGAGISILDPQANLIETMRHNAYDQQSMSSSFVWSIMEDKKGRIWIGTNKTGINIFDPSNRTFEYYTHDPGNPSSLPNPSVREIFETSKGTVWIGTDGGGLSKFNPGDGDFYSYTNDLNDTTSISDNSVRTIYEDSTGILWIGTRNGLNRFNPSKGTFKRYLHDPENPSSISNNFVYSSIYMDQRGILWLGTYGGGLNKLDTKTGKFTNFQFDAENISSISDNIVFSIYEDGKGYFWIGTNSGLNLFNPSTGKFKRYGVEAGLPNEVIYGIMPDNENRLWMTTNKGISRLDLTEFEFKNFDVRDGLQSNEFNGGAFHVGRSGVIYGGGVYGMNIINPSEIVPVENNAEIIVSRLEILGKEVTVAPVGSYIEEEEENDAEPDQLIEIVDNFYLPIHVTYLSEIKLNYRQRFFSIEFAALNHHMPEKLNYRHRMVNLEDHWNIAGNRNYVTYANMKPGVYIFEVDASNTDGFLTNNPARLKIIITPPFWLRYWFIILEILAAIGITIFIYRFLLHQRTNTILTAQYDEIKKAHRQLQISENNLMELNATKDKFFSIISHDLKNPFASVLSISELLDDSFENTDEDELRYGVKKIRETNQHIYELLENLLTWSKSQRGRLIIEAGSFNLSKVIETNINLLKLAAEKKIINIEANIADEMCAFADREMISTVIRNLLTNAVKFTEAGKSIEIKVDVMEKVNKVSIIDQGVGITPENIERLFKIEDKIKTEGTAGEKGTGLGLIICQEFVENNHGTIEVSSAPGKGSTFTFTVPRSDG